MGLVQRSFGGIFQRPSPALTVQRHALPTLEEDWQPSAVAPELVDEGAGTGPSGSPDARPAGASPTTEPAGGKETQEKGITGEAGQAPTEAPLIIDSGTGTSPKDKAQLEDFLHGDTGPAKLDSQTAAKRFAKDMVGEEREWATQATPEARAQALTNMLGRRLSDAGVSPVPNYTLRTDLAPGTLGNFGFTTWTININKTLVSAPNLTPDQADLIANTFYHEGRHCDQWFRMARLRAGQKVKAKDIASAMQIPNNVAASAAANPIKDGSDEAKEAQVWWDSIYGAKHDARNATLNGLDADSRAVVAAEKANQDAEKAYNDDKSPAKLAAWQATWKALQDARTKHHQTFAAYQALPEEVSARAAADTMSAALTAARKQAGQPPDAPKPKPPPGTDGAGDFEPSPDSGMAAA